MRHPNWTPLSSTIGGSIWVPHPEYRGQNLRCYHLRICILCSKERARIINNFDPFPSSLGFPPFPQRNVWIIVIGWLGSFYISDSYEQPGHKVYTYSWTPTLYTVFTMSIISKQKNFVRDSHLLNWSIKVGLYTYILVCKLMFPCLYSTITIFILVSEISTFTEF